MAVNNDSSIHPISSDASQGDIISTLNHNFQVLTERIKAFNIQLSYLDILKIATIFKATVPQGAQSQSTLDDNLQRFVSTCWNTLANYSGVYISCEKAGVTLFTWMNTHQVKNGDFIVKLPNNQSLYLPGADPTYMVPNSSFNVASSQINFTADTSATTVTVGGISFPEYVSSGLQYTTVTVSSEATISYPADLRDVRFFINDGGDDNGQEVFFATRPTQAPVALRIQEFFKNK